jgi:hypothetical protein
MGAIPILDSLGATLYKTALLRGPLVNEAPQREYGAKSLFALGPGSSVGRALH